VVEGHAFREPQIDVPLCKAIQQGVDIRTVAQLMGHRTIQMAMCNGHLAPKEDREAVEKLVSS